MRLLLIVLALVLVGCKPDPIEACVEAEKNALFQKYCPSHDSCTSEYKKEAVIVFEPSWRKKCMLQAAGKVD